MDISSELRLSAVRAFLGSVYPEMRLIKIIKVGHDIRLTVIVDRSPTERIESAISIAATEIVADFANAHIHEVVEVNILPLPEEDAHRRRLDLSACGVIRHSTLGSLWECRSVDSEHYAR
jgi:hypothetical protein